MDKKHIIITSAAAAFAASIALSQPVYADSKLATAIDNPTAVHAVTTACAASGCCGATDTSCAATNCEGCSGDSSSCAGQDGCGASS
jgi:hypothetical protein